VDQRGQKGQQTFLLTTWTMPIASIRNQGYATGKKVKDRKSAVVGNGRVSLMTKISEN